MLFSLSPSFGVALFLRLYSALAQTHTAPIERQAWYFLVYFMSPQRCTVGTNSSLKL